MINEKKFHETYKNFDREIVIEIIDIFLKEYNDRIEKISNNLNQANFDELSKSTHAFRGVIANFETECSAYSQILEIENTTRDFLKKKSENPHFEDMEFREKTAQLFTSFKQTSRKMYNQLKEMRSGYED